MSAWGHSAEWGAGRSGEAVRGRPHDGLRLRPLLVFDDPAYESDFVRYYNRFYYRYAQVSLIVGMLLVSADFLVDLLASKATPANLDRLLLCVPLLGLGLVGSFADYARRHWQPVMSGLITAIAGSLFWVLLVIDNQGGMGMTSWVGILNFVFLEFYCFVVLGVQFRYALAAGAIVLAMFELALLRAIGADSGAFLYLSYHAATLFILAAGIGWWREFLLRKGFAAQTSLRAAQNVLRNQNGHLELEVEKSTQRIQRTQDVTIEILTSLAETRDNETGNHIRRTQHYVRALARRLQSHPAFAAYLVEAQIDMLFKYAPLHDIGKVGIPDSILLKPGKLDPHEFEIMKTHTTLGYQTIVNAEKRLGTPVAFLACAKEIALSHHEHWDGNGYPNRLAGEAIPISARLMAVADVYDALTSRRVYKDAMPHDRAVAIIKDGSGRQFDPDVVDAFVAIAADEFKTIAARYAD
ncbi:metal dependent phosphohydrolase [Rhodopseudomonas palustris HaA2]|uniref:Metal dependent phosphohydrolase n=1 Tax=Rhodopseudomonas palustris (strain HaA2) TaxID=316058 RepID=Q2IXM5_RHOP2|nr:HD domain-containing phosphohydrolase [Rhodopseudomonas palustris]ABD07035.1 metal dependent phosphohydrolase [Rhodopseudomonas palustris HaA2]